MAIKRLFAAVCRFLVVLVWLFGGLFFGFCFFFILGFCCLVVFWFFFL